MESNLSWSKADLQMWVTVFAHVSLYAFVPECACTGVICGYICVYVCVLNAYEGRSVRASLCPCY